MSTQNDPEVGFEPAASASAYEVRCLHCNTSFAPGTRRCIHCGERIGRLPDLRLGLPFPPDGAEPDEGMPTGSAARTGLWAVTAVIAMAGSFFRMCQGG